MIEFLLYLLGQGCMRSFEKLERWRARRNVARQQALDKTESEKDQ